MKTLRGLIYSACVVGITFAGLTVVPKTAKAEDPPTVCECSTDSVGDAWCSNNYEDNWVCTTGGLHCLSMILDPSYEECSNGGNCNGICSATE
jgi:hypothetical protein